MLDLPLKFELVKDDLTPDWMAEPAIPEPTDELYRLPPPTFEPSDDPNLDPATLDERDEPTPELRFDPTVEPKFEPTLELRLELRPLTPDWMFESKPDGLTLELSADP